MKKTVRSKRHPTIQEAVDLLRSAGGGLYEIQSVVDHLTLAIQDDIDIDEIVSREQERAALIGSTRLEVTGDDLGFMKFHVDRWNDLYGTHLPNPITRSDTPTGWIPPKVPAGAKA